MFRILSHATIFVGLAMIGQAAHSAEICNDGAKVTVKGTISKIDDKSDANGKAWVLRPNESDEQSSCLSLSADIRIDGDRPEECKPGARFSLSGAMKDGAVLGQKIHCYYPTLSEETGDPREDCSPESGPEIRVSSCTKLIEENPREIEPYLLRGNAYSSLDMSDLAIADFTQIIKINANWGPAYINRANAYVIAGRLDQAIADATKALKINKGKAVLNDVGRAKAHSIRGMAYMLRDRTDLAVADLQMALKYDPMDLGATRQLADLYMHDGNFQQAIDMLSDAIAAQPIAGLPDMGVLLRLRGFAHFCMRQFKEAGADFAKSIEQGASADAIFFKFIADTRSGEDATKDLRESLPLFQGADAWQRQIVDLFLGEGRPEGILDAARPSDQTCLAALYLGEWYLLRGNKDKSRELFEEASQECPEHSSAGYVAAVELGR